METFSTVQNSYMNKLQTYQMVRVRLLHKVSHRIKFRTLSTMYDISHRKETLVSWRFHVAFVFLFVSVCPSVCDRR